MQEIINNTAEQRPPAVYIQHKELIIGLDQIYTTLQELHYLGSSDIQRKANPSQIQSSDILRSKGLSQPAIDLLGYLTYPSNDILNQFDHLDQSLPIAPDSGAISYLRGVQNSELHYARSPFPFDEGTRLPPSAIKLTCSYNGIGFSYICDLDHSRLAPGSKTLWKNDR